MPRLTYWPSSSADAAIATISLRVHIFLRLLADGYSPLFDVFCSVSGRDHALDEDARRDHFVGIQITVDDSFSLGIVTRPAAATSGLKLRAVIRYRRLPSLSA